jgi:hypothetical protein
LLIWSVGSSLAVYSHSLSYFNELAIVLPTPADGSYPMPMEKTNKSIVSTIINAGPLNGPRHLLDSNIDWGQDLFYLEDWYESHPEARPIKVAYSGGYPLDKTKIKSDGYPPSGPDKELIDNTADTTAVGPLPGWYALSVNSIYSRDHRYRYFLNFQPEAMAGYSIYIYHITIADANRVRRRLGLRELPENWRPSEEDTHVKAWRYLPPTKVRIQMARPVVSDDWGGLPIEKLCADETLPCGFDQVAVGIGGHVDAEHAATDLSNQLRVGLGQRMEQSALVHRGHGVKNSDHVRYAAVDRKQRLLA